MKPLILTLTLTLLCPTAQADDTAILNAYIIDFMRPIRNSNIYKRRLKRALTFIPVIIEQSWAHGIDSSLVAVTISCESAWNPGALGARGAHGLMQIMPGREKYKGADLMDGRVNIAVGVEILADCLKACDTLTGALSFYLTGLGCRPIVGGARRRLGAYKRAVKRFRK